MVGDEGILLTTSSQMLGSSCPSPIAPHWAPSNEGRRRVGLCKEKSVRQVKSLPMDLFHGRPVPHPSCLFLGQHLRSCVSSLPSSLVFGPRRVIAISSHRG